MTLAICLKCGAEKLGAFTPCPRCKYMPESEDELSTSVFLTDHYQDESSLKEAGRKIAAGEPIYLDDEMVSNMSQTLRSTGYYNLLNALKGRPEPPAPTPKQTFVRVLRWIAVLPAAILGGFIANILFLLINKITMLGYIDPNSFMAKLFLAIAGGAVFGASIVYVAAYVAPSHRKPVAVVFAGLVVLLSGLSLLFVISRHDWWGLLNLITGIGGAAAMATEVVRGTIRSLRDDTSGKEVDHA